MSSKGTIVLLALLSSLLVTISESRATRAITDEEVQQNEAISEKPAAESSKNDQWSTDSDVIKADEMKLAFGVRLSDSTLTQVPYTSACAFSILPRNRSILFLSLGDLYIACKRSRIDVVKIETSLFVQYRRHACTYNGGYLYIHNILEVVRL